jgi:type IV secretory pathway VirB2 component (pilin)
VDDGVREASRITPEGRPLADGCTSSLEVEGARADRKVSGAMPSKVRNREVLCTMADVLHGPVQLVVLIVVLALAAWMVHRGARRGSDYVTIAVLFGGAALLGTEAGADGLQII